MITVDQIKAAVVREFNVGLSDMTNAKRLRRVARPRQVAMYLSRELTTNKLSAIGSYFGDRDHTTVRHAVARVNGLMAGDEDFRARVEAVRGSLVVNAA